ncbi:MAG: hypothetical protein IKZ49_04285 [Alphaproteobacteria bacterium]|nr:hypothetical protein [Alphaproteobacteria bacterium]
MQKTISYEPFCVDGYLIVPHEEKKITSVYNITGGAPVLNAYLEICALPKQISFRHKFDRQVFDILNKSGLYKSEKSVRNSFFTPFEKGELSSKFDSSILLRLSTAHFVQYLFNSKKQEVCGIYFEDCSLNNARTVGGIKEFEQEIQKSAEWQRKVREFNEKIK